MPYKVYAFHLFRQCTASLPRPTKKASQGLLAGDAVFRPDSRHYRPLPREQCCLHDTGRSSGSRISLIDAPSRPLQTVAPAPFVPGDSGGSATGLHRLPLWLSPSHPCIQGICNTGTEGQSRRRPAGAVASRSDGTCPLAAPAYRSDRAMLAGGSQDHAFYRPGRLLDTSHSLCLE